MDNGYTKKTFILDLTRNFATIFTLTVLAISIAGLLVSRYSPDIQTLALFSSGFNVILQIAGFSFVMAFFCVLLISECFIYRMQFWLRILLLFISVVITFSVFAVIFKWFSVDALQIDALQTWLGFIICVIICYVLSVSLTLLKFKLEGRKYDRLLADYKARKKNPA